MKNLGQRQNIFNKYFARKIICLRRVYIGLKNKSLSQLDIWQLWRQVGQNNVSLVSKLNILCQCPLPANISSAVTDINDNASTDSSLHCTILLQDYYWPHSRPGQLGHQCNASLTTLSFWRRQFKAAKNRNDNIQ